METFPRFHDFPERFRRDTLLFFMKEKFCCSCKNIKSLSEFYFTKYGRQSICRKCACIKSKLYREKNPEKWKETKLKCLKKHLDKYREIANKYAKNYRQTRRELANKYAKQYRQNNPEKVYIGNLARKKRTKLQTPLWARRGVIMRRMTEIYRKRPDGYEVDHIIPIKGKIVSGLHVPWNLQYLPIKENRKKRNSFIIQ